MKNAKKKWGGDARGNEEAVKGQQRPGRAAEEPGGGRAPAARTLAPPRAGGARLLPLGGPAANARPGSLPPCPLWRDTYFPEPLTPITTSCTMASPPAAPLSLPLPPAPCSPPPRPGPALPLGAASAPAATCGARPGPSPPPAPRGPEEQVVAYGESRAGGFGLQTQQPLPPHSASPLAGLGSEG